MGKTRLPKHAGGNERRSRRRKSLRYQLQMVTIIRTGAGKVEGDDGERVEEERDIAATASTLLSQKEGGVGGHGKDDCRNAASLTHKR